MLVTGVSLLVIMLLTAADAYMLYQLISVSAATRSALIGDVRSMDMTKELRSSLYDEERNAQKYMATEDSTYRVLFREQHRVSQAMLDTLRRLNDDRTVLDLVQTAGRRHGWYAAALTRQGLVSRLHRDSLQTAMTDSLEEIYHDVDQLVGIKQHVLADAVAEAEESARRAAEVALLLTMGAVLAAVTIALVITRSITRPLGALMRATDEVARGTFTRVAMATRGDLGRLAEAFNSMGDRLRKANAARAEMMHHISHEIRMPLQTMHSAYYLLSEQQAGPVNDRQRKLLETIRDNVDKITRFSNQFLDLARLEAGMMEFDVGPTDLEPVLASLVADAAVNAARKEIALSYHPAPLPPVLANAERCGQVFANLLNNAVKYTNAGGSVHVTTCPSALGAERHALPGGLESRPQLLERAEEVPPDVVPERAERGDVQHAHPARPRGAGREAVERRQEGGERLAASRRCDREKVLAGVDPRPGEPLDLGRLAVPLVEPARHDRVHAGDCTGRWRGRPPGVFSQRGQWPTGRRLGGAS